MRFVMIKTPDRNYSGDIILGESVAVNVDNISSVKIVSGESLVQKVIQMITNPLN